MSVTIILPKEGGIKSGAGTTVFNDAGNEITGVTNINISIALDEIITAVVDVYVNSIDNMDNVHALLGTQTLEDIAALHGKVFCDKKSESLASIDFKVDASEIDEICKLMGIVEKYAEELPQEMKAELQELIK